MARFMDAAAHTFKAGMVHDKIYTKSVVKRRYLMAKDINIDVKKQNTKLHTSQSLHLVKQMSPEFVALSILPNNGGRLR